MRIALRVLGSVLCLAYPIVVWTGLSMTNNRFVGPLLLAALSAFLVVLGFSRRGGHVEYLPYFAIPLSVIALLSVLLDDRRFLLSVPVLVNAALLVVFGSSLLEDRMPTVERFARMIHKELSPDRVLYCRAVTKVWCLFFVLNGIASLGLALFAPFSAWAVYTGVISYLLMGALFAGEYAVRRIRFG